MTMNPFRRQSTWDRAAGKAADVLPTQAIKTGATAVGTLVGATLLSAAISAARQRAQKS